ncbi:hypothetical protein [Kaistella sp.]|uniref:hypothetical protein n=1 Tax=Kaistella sp. TaxID=2782235 RepID=UPI0035A0A705
MRKELLVPQNALYLLILLSFIFTFFNITFDITSVGIPLEWGRILVVVGLVASFVVSVVLIVDVFKNDVNGKYLWTLAFLMSAGLLGYFYLRSRDHYLSRTN